ncbi:MAG: DUF4405 domain-containing protein [Caldilineaceae bacterium]|nr:DUF4405 domain-containing protein [Caldilineaceae bacterium]
MQTEQLAPTIKFPRVKLHPTKLNLWVDVAIFAAFLVATAPHFTGMAVHEWLSLALAAALVTHQLLHWAWIVQVTRRFLRSAPRSARINYVLNTLLFIVVTLVIFTGVMISEQAMPALGIEIARNMLWRQLHGLLSDAAVVLLGLHVALHWRWIAGSVRRYVVNPVANVLRRPALTHPVQKESQL